MNTLHRNLFLSALCSTALSAPAFAGGHFEACTGGDWVFKDDITFAEDCAEMAFTGSLEDRQVLAWMFFSRLNQQVPADVRVDMPGTAPLWMAWPTDPETFPKEAGTKPEFTFEATMVTEDLSPSESKTVLAGQVSDDSKDGVPNSGAEEVTRNQVGFDYIVENTLYTTPGVQRYITGDGDPSKAKRVDMPVGSVETKAKWLKVDSPDDAPDGAFVFQFLNSKSGEEEYHYWGGLHIMAKMLPSPDDIFYDNSPSWFWTTFEYRGNPGTEHVVTSFITEKSPLDSGQIEEILTVAGIESFGYQAYAPNGTQINFVTDAGDPVILGHTQMEDFAGAPNSAKPAEWTVFNSSCHACHATASIQPDTGDYYPFSVPIGMLSPTQTSSSKIATYALGDGFVPLDFMWPIVFNARAED